MKNEQKGKNMKERSNLSRWTTARKWLLPVLVTLTGAFPFASFATDREFNVPQGETGILTNMVETLGYTTITHGDTLIKTGRGVLTIDEPFPYRMHLRIEEGACVLDGTGTVFRTSGYGDRYIKILSGATLNIGGRNGLPTAWIQVPFLV